MEDEIKTVEDYKKEIISYFEKGLFETEKVLKKRVPHGVFINGKRVKLHNGKTVWWQKNHASSAITNSVTNITPRWTERESNKRNFLEAFKELKEQGIIEVKVLMDEN